MIDTTLVHLFNDKNQILLCEKKRGFGEGKLNGSGGKVILGETIEQATIRELKEETGIYLGECDLVKRGVLNFYFDHKPEWNQCVHYYTGNYNGDFQETEEMKPYWIDIDNIPYDQMWSDDIYWLPRILDGEKYIEYNFRFDEDGLVKKYEQIS